MNVNTNVNPNDKQQLTCAYIHHLYFGYIFQKIRGKCIFFKLIHMY